MQRKRGGKTCRREVMSTYCLPALRTTSPGADRSRGGPAREWAGRPATTETKEHNMVQGITGSFWAPGVTGRNGCVIAPRPPRRLARRLPGKGGGGDGPVAGRPSVGVAREEPWLDVETEGSLAAWGGPKGRGVMSGVGGGPVCSPWGGASRNGGRMGPFGAGVWGMDPMARSAAPGGGGGAGVEEGGRVGDPAEVSPRGGGLALPAPRGWASLGSSIGAVRPW